MTATYHCLAWCVRWLARVMEITIAVPIVLVVALLTAGPAMAGVLLRRCDYRWYP